MAINLYCNATPSVDDYKDTGEQIDVKGSINGKKVEDNKTLISIRQRIIALQK